MWQINIISPSLPCLLKLSAPNPPPSQTPKKAANQDTARNTKCKIKREQIFLSTSQPRNTKYRRSFPPLPGLTKCTPPPSQPARRRRNQPAGLKSQYEKINAALWAGEGGGLMCILDHDTLDLRKLYIMRRGNAELKSLSQFS